MDAGSNLEAKAVRRLADRGRTADSALGPVELGEHAVAGGLYESSPMPIDRRRGLAVVLADEVAPARGAELARTAGRIDDIGEDHRRKDPFIPGVTLSAEGPHRLEVDRNPRLVSDDPGIVAGRDLEDVTRTQLEFGAVGHLGAQSSG